MGGSKVGSEEGSEVGRVMASGVTCVLGIEMGSGMNNVVGSGVGTLKAESRELGSSAGK